MTDVAALLTILAIVTAIVFGPLWAPYVYYGIMRRTASSDQFTNLVIDLLRIGQDWTVDQYHASHPCGVRIWIANGRDRLRYEQGDRRKMSYTDQCRIWSAFRAMQEREGDAAAATLAAAIVKRYSKEQSA